MLPTTLRIVKKLVEEEIVSKYSPVDGMKWWAKYNLERGHLSVFKASELKVIYKHAPYIIKRMRDYFAEIEEYNAELKISQMVDFD